MDQQHVGPTGAPTKSEVLRAMIDGLPSGQAAELVRGQAPEDAEGGRERIVDDKGITMALAVSATRFSSV